MVSYRDSKNNFKIIRIKEKEAKKIKRFIILAEAFTEDLDDTFVKACAEKGLRQELGSMVDRVAVKKMGETSWLE